MEFVNPTDIGSIVRPPTRFFLYSRVSLGIGVPLFLGHLYTPLVCFSYVLGFSFGSWNTSDIGDFVHLSAAFFLYSSISHVDRVLMFLGPLYTLFLCFLCVLGVTWNF